MTERGIGRPVGSTDARDHLERAAWQLFQTRGYDAVTTQAIATIAGCSQRTFFRHYPTKEDVVLSWMDGHNKAICARISADPSPGSAPAVLRRALDVYGDMSAPDRERLAALSRLATSSPALLGGIRARQGKWEDAIAATLVAHPLLDVGEIQSFHLAAYAMAALGVAMRMSARPGSGTTAEHLDAAFELLRDEHPHTPIR
ncbi:TetR/AcrR family transcriptional regulator [Sphingopyxis sp.]|uniref:TetR/AcrR family transcriptional regulator n=1 Tax=Sphingopyxis sp. TaxID=1908224 RepID=UPI003D6D458E